MGAAVRAENSIARENATGFESLKDALSSLESQAFRYNEYHCAGLHRFGLLGTDRFDPRCEVSCYDGIDEDTEKRMRVAEGDYDYLDTNSEEKTEHGKECYSIYRFIHYGINNEKKDVIKAIYRMRRDRLRNSGIILSEEEFISLAVRWYEKKQRANQL